MARCGSGRVGSKACHSAVMKLLVSLSSLWKRCEGDEETEEEQRKDDSLLKESVVRDE